jgi:hypothetical protein
MERRTQKRIKISYYLPIINADSYEQLGILTEITPTGLQVDSQKSIPVETILKLRLDLSDQKFGQNFITFQAQVRWLRQDRIDPGFYNIGFMILSLSNSDKKVVEKIMESYAAWKQT